MRQFLLCLPFLLLLLLACRPVGPTYVPPAQSLPDTYTASGGRATLTAQWWEPLGDSLLNGLIQRALVQSPDLRIVEARLRQARAMQGIQDAAGGPQLSVGGLVSKDRLSPNSEMLADLPFKNIQTEFTNHQIAFDASWEIDVFGHNRRLSEAARARAEASAERLRDAGLIMSAEVARNYIEYRTWQQRLTLALDNLKNHEELVRLTTLEVKAGEVTNLEVQRVETSRRVHEASLADIRLGMRQSLAALSTLTDLPMASLEACLGDALRPLTVPEAPTPGIPSDLLKRRPDVRIAERELAAASADIGVAVADRYPRFSLVGMGGWASVQSGTLLENASRMWSLGPQFHLPIFDSGQLKNQVQANVAAFEAASSTYRKAVLIAVADVEVALTRMSRSEDRRRQLLDAEAQQRRLVSLTELQLKAGEVSKITLLEARRNLMGQEDQTLQARAQSLSALVSLCKALGGGWAD
jgi:NodT family efflux transporter outer membrane factor (OMF) lipoprotein